MIKAVFLDLDNTLLINPDRAFTTEYVHLLEKFFKSRCDHPDLKELIFGATQALKRNDSPAVTNFNAAAKYLIRATGVPALTISVWLSEFMDEAYPALKTLTRPAECGAELVAYLRANEIEVAIATNPLYPADAIKQRLEWAALSSDLDDYAFVSHAQNMHFAKPNPAYYAEMVGRVGVEPDEVVMVGDSVTNDIQPASILGIRTFHITRQSGISSDPSLGAGSLRQFYELVRGGVLDTLELPLVLSPEMILPQLWGNVGAFYGLVDNLPERFWLQHPDPNEWSVQQIVCHMADSEEDMQRPRLQRIVTEEKPFLSAPKNPPGPREYACEGHGMDYLRRFEASRRRTIEFLKQLKTDDWQRPARDSIFGPTTLVEMAYFTAQHDRLHLRQLCQTIDKCE